VKSVKILDLAAKAGTYLQKYENSPNTPLSCLFVSGTAISLMAESFSGSGGRVPDPIISPQNLTLGLAN